MIRGPSGRGRRVSRETPAWHYGEGVHSPSRRVGLLVNPTSGGGRGKKAGAQVAQALGRRGHRVVDLSALTAEAASVNVRDAVGEIDALIVVGGDGMVHLGIQALAETSVPLGVVPVGTGNDFAAALGIAGPPGRVIREIIDRLSTAGGARRIDLLRVTGDGLGRGGVRWVGGAVSAGLDAAVNARANRLRFSRGSARYIVAAAWEILAYRSWAYDVMVRGALVTPPRRERLDGFAGMAVHDANAHPHAAGDATVTWAERGALVTVANTPTIGGGIRVAPDARLDDALLDVVIARDVGRSTAARLFPLLVVGAHLRSSQIRTVQGREVAIASPAGAAHAPEVYGDGEQLGTLPVRVELRPGALAVLH